ncbi:UrcA family protein [Sphingomonas koreensis]
MRRTILFSILLLSACAEGRAEPVARLTYGDLTLESREGRVMLRERVTRAARNYCVAYGAEMTPYASRADPYYCTDMFRSWIIGKMRPDIRRAYFLARQEAGVKGRQP